MKAIGWVDVHAVVYLTALCLGVATLLAGCTPPCGGPNGEACTVGIDVPCSAAPGKPCVVDSAPPGGGVDCTAPQRQQYEGECTNTLNALIDSNIDELMFMGSNLFPPDQLSEMLKAQNSCTYRCAEYATHRCEQTYNIDEHWPSYTQDEAWRVTFSRVGGGDTYGTFSNTNCPKDPSYPGDCGLPECLLSSDIP